MSLTAAILAAMAIGALFGWVFPSAVPYLTPLTDIFLILVRSIIGPLVFSALVVGIASTSGQAAGRIGIKALAYFQIVTLVALSLGMAAANWFQPGDGMSLRTAESIRPPAPIRWQAMLENAVPTSMIDALARNEMLPIVVVASLFGAACAAIGAKAKPVVAFCEAVTEIMFRYTGYIMYLAPPAVGAAMAATMASQGLGVTINLGRLIAAEYAALLGLVCLYWLLMLILRIPLRRFASAIREPFAIAFATTASGAAFPVAMEKMTAFGVPRPVLNLVMPLGFSFNTAGTALHIALSTLFLAQAVGRPFAVNEQVALLGIWLVTTKGVAAVPRTSLVVIIGTMTQFGVPLDALPVLLGVDIVLDMGRTSTNLIGNCLAPAVIARWEKESSPPRAGIPARTDSA